VYIFVNNNTNLNFLKILSNYTIWDRLSQKTISRYCPFKQLCWEKNGLSFFIFFLSNFQFMDFFYSILRLFWVSHLQCKHSHGWDGKRTISCVHHGPKAHIEKVGEDKSRICLVLFLKIYQQIWKVENEDDKIIDIKIAETLWRLLYFCSWLVLLSLDQLEKRPNIFWPSLIWGSLLGFKLFALPSLWILSIGSISVCLAHYH
jgi:hypothetical protein